MMSRDPGLQPERTAMAWHRTGMAAASVGVVATFTVVRQGGAFLIALSAIATAGAAASSGFAATRRQPELRDQLPSPWSRLVWTCAVVVMMAALGVMIALVDR